MSERDKKKGHFYINTFGVAKAEWSTLQGGIVGVCVQSKNSHSLEKNAEITVVYCVMSAHPPAASFISSCHFFLLSFYCSLKIKLYIIRCVLISQQLFEDANNRIKFNLNGLFAFPPPPILSFDHRFRHIFHLKRFSFI